jgi:hypothetical protein
MLAALTCLGLIAVLVVCARILGPLRVGAWWTLIRHYADDSSPDVLESFCAVGLARSAWGARGRRPDLLDVGRSARGLHLSRSVAVGRNRQVVIPWTAIEARTGDGRREILAVRAGSGTVHLSLPAGFIPLAGDRSPSI